jgi:hypothetical protein
MLPNSGAGFAAAINRNVVRIFLIYFLNFFSDKSISLAESVG